MKIVLPDSVLKKAIDYYEKTGSLSKTSRYISEGCPNNDGVQTEIEIRCTRHPLTRIFRENGVKINEPNGERVKEKRRRLSSDGYTRFCKEALALAFCDAQYIDPKRPEDYVSAAYFILRSSIYRLFAAYVHMNPDYYPDFVIQNRETLEKAADIYEEFCQKELPYHFRQDLWKMLKERGVVNV